MSLPNFTWDIDPVFYRFDLPLFPTLLVVAAIGAIGALAARRKQDQSGQRLGWAVAVIAGLASLYYKGETWSPGLRYYSLLFVGVFLGGYALLHWQLRRGGSDEEEAGDYIVYGVVAVLAGARLGHVLFYDLDKALRDPGWVLKIWTGGLASHGAVIGLIVSMWLFTKRRGVPFLEGSDRFAFSAALGATLVRAGNFFNSEIVGRVTDQSWGVRFPRYIGDSRLAEAPLRHPSQLYEVALGLIVLAVLFVADRLLGKEKRPRGIMIALFFAVYFTGRFGIEFVKEYQTLESDALLTMGQWLSIPGAAIGYWGVWWSLKQRLPVGWHPTVRRDRDEDYVDYGDDDYSDLDDEEMGADHADSDVDAEFGGAPKKRRKRKARDADEDEVPTPAPKKKRKKKAKRKTRQSAPKRRAHRDHSWDEDTSPDSPHSRRSNPAPKKSKPGDGSESDDGAESDD